MCGLLGFVDRTRNRTASELDDIVRRMAQTLHHRGPDDGGTYVDAARGVALGHRRLSILDLSPAGHQPMASHDGRLVLVYNGEVYNHLHLREDLTRNHGVTFRGTSDTETLVEAIRVWGTAATLVRCRGIFALALYDTQTGEVTLARDHLGIKPLYVGQQGGLVLFGSELKALRAHPDFRAEIDRGVLGHYLRHNYVPGPYSIYRQVRKLPPGTSCIISADGALSEPMPFWSLTDVALAGARQPLSGSADELRERLEAELQRAVREQKLADVPLGAFLSGGIDSSLVVALMQAHSVRPVKTFTIGFEEDEYNEAPYARKVAAYLGTDHTEHYVSARQAQAVIPLLPAMFDEPFADSSQIPTYLVSQLAREQVTVVLSGDGGDELFCGYLRYFAPLLGARNRLAASMLRRPAGWMARLGARWLPHPRGRRFLSRAATFLADAHPDDRYLRGLTHWPLGEPVVLGDPAWPETRFQSRTAWPEFPEPQQRWMWLDTLTYLPDDILVKVDRASMAVSLEARVPLLDPGVVELAWRLPHASKARNWTGKLILRDILARYVPPALFERPKKGFGVPIASWLRGPLRDWAAALIDPRRLQREGYFNPAKIQQVWTEHQSGRIDRAYQLWDVLMFQAWREEVDG